MAQTSLCFKLVGLIKSRAFFWTAILKETQSGDQVNLSCFDFEICFHLAFGTPSLFNSSIKIDLLTFPARELSSIKRWILAIIPHQIFYFKVAGLVSFLRSAWIASLLNLHYNEFPVIIFRTDFMAVLWIQ